MAKLSASRWRVDFGSAVDKELKRSPHLCRPFLKALHKLRRNPYRGDGIKRVRGCPDCWRIKVNGRLRLIYTIDAENRTLYLIRLGHRDALYSRLSRRK